jgi:hypothetical protein
MNAHINGWAAALLLAALLGVAGCGNGLVSASGRLTYKGKPVPSTVVYFLPEDGSRRSTGLTDDDGHFSLRFSRDLSGVKIGKHTVYLRYDVSAEEETHQIPPKASAQIRSVITRYGDPKTSPLHYAVTHSGQVFEITLE